MVKEMTKGKPALIIAGFCFPLLIGNIFQQFYNLVDCIIVGRYIGVNALAAVGSTASLNFLVLGFVFGICNGFSIPISQRFGAGDYASMRRFLANSMYLSVFFIIFLTSITMIFTRPLLELMDTPEEIIKDSYDYIITIFSGIGAILVYNLMSSLLRAVGDSKSPLYFLVIACILNIFLDLLFVITFQMGVMGAGLATIIAQIIAAALCVVYVRKNFPILTISREEMKFSWEHSKKLLSIGVPMALQFSITAVGTIILQTAVNRLGTDIVAAVTAGNRINLVMFQPLETLGATMATYCGQNVGAYKLSRVKQGLKTALLMMIVYCLFAGLVLWFYGGNIASLFLGEYDEGIIGSVSYFLKFYGVSYPILGLLFIFRNSVQGMGFSILPMCAGISELVARAVISFLLVGVFGFTAICIAGPAAWLFGVLLLIPAYFISMKKLLKNSRTSDG